MSFFVESPARSAEVSPSYSGGRLRLRVDGQVVDAQLEPADSRGGDFVLECEGVREPVVIIRDRDRIWLHLRGQSLELRVASELERIGERARSGAGGGRLQAPMPGVVVEVLRAVGDSVEAGETILVIESMKLQTRIVAPCVGCVSELLVAEGSKFEQGAVLALVESDETSAAEGGAQ